MIQPGALSVRSGMQDDAGGKAVSELVAWPHQVTCVVAVDGSVVIHSDLPGVAMELW